MPDADLTDVGVGGINLSGGQKWRVSFARALYSRAGVLVLDDIFSAVDIHVGRRLLENALCGELVESRTRILATHHTDLCLPWARCHVQLENGTVHRVQYFPETELRPIIPRLSAHPNVSLCRLSSIVESYPGKGHEPPPAIQASVLLDGATRVTLQPRKFIEVEKRDSGPVKGSTYKKYVMAAGGSRIAAIVLLTHIGYMASILGREIRKFKCLKMEYLLISNLCSGTHGIYLGLSVGICFLFVVKFFSVLAGSIRASRVLFEDFNKAIFHAPIRWLDTTPTGRILNRFTADFNAVDESMADGLGFFINQVLQLAAIVVAGAILSPAIVIVAAVLLLFCVYVAKLYLPGARDVKRIESVTRSPIFDQLESASAGVGTIRVYNMTDVYVRRMYCKIDEHARATWHRYLFNLWMILRLNAVGAVFATLVAALTVWNADIDASLAGFALSFALQYTVAIEWAIRQYSSTQLNMNSTERILEYSHMKTETNSGREVPASWPSEGVVEYENFTAGYEPGQSVLKGLSFRIARNQRIGIVGRTGAGKSSLTLTLFRFLEATRGRILIDDVDISTIKLDVLRRRLAIVPQDPMLFAGTIRSNLDPIEEYTDTELHCALSEVHVSVQAGSATWGATSRDTFGSLSFPISAGGHNLSQGQRQLLCLARALVSRRKIIVMDEATASVDRTTDVLIQRSLREGFKDSTLLVVAHRLSTVADFDKILVLDGGRAVEYDAPSSLMERKGLYWSMMSSAAPPP
ncbi:MAG: hypothetical protein Q9206_001653 [Seirophora lacunosa]